MKPILYHSDETDFGHNGIGILVDTVEAFVTEERNGMFELQFVYPITGLHFERIQEDCIVKAKPNDTMQNQLFRIYKSTKPINGLVTFYAQHISYDLRYNPLPKIQVSGPGQVALNAILTNAVNPHPFTGYSDVTTNSSTEIGPVNVRQALGGTDGSLLDHWGGEFEFDNFTIRHLQNRGKDTGILVSYGKNLTDYEQEKELDSVFTSVYPFAIINTENGEQLLTLPEKIISLESESTYPIKRTMMLDLSGDQSVTDVNSLREAAIKYAKNNKIDQPRVNWKISFVNLAQTEDYKHIAALERVNLCDYVIVRFEKYNVDVKAQVIRTVYDVLKEKYREIELGNAKSDFANDFRNTKKETLKEFNKQQSFFQAAIQRATDAITGTSGGYIRLNPKEHPQEILIMDKPNIEEATRVWRWNLGGLGYSRNGYNGPYELAMTMDGEIVANFITAGVLQAIGIKGVSIEGSTFKIEDGTFLLEINKDVGISIKRGSQTIFSVNPNTNKAEINGGTFITETGATRAELGYQGTMFRIFSKDFPDRQLTLDALRIAIANEDYRTYYDPRGFSFFVGNDNEAVCFLSISDTNPSYFYLEGNMSIEGDVSANNFINNSLEELKQDIEELPEGFATEVINNMDVYSFKYKRDAERGIQKKKYGPVIGTDYITPNEILNPDETGTDDHSAIYLAIKALQEANKRIEQLEKEIARLKEGTANAK